jgi:integrase
MKPERKYLKTKKQYYYRFRLMINNSVFRTPWMPTIEMAKDEYAKLRESIKTGQRNSGSEMSLRDFAEEWLQKHAYAKKEYVSALRDEQHLNIHVLPTMGNCKLRNISASQIDGLISHLKLRATIAPKTINNVLGTIKKMFNDAVKWGYLAYSPAKLVTPLKVATLEVQYLSDDEVARLLGYCARHDFDCYAMIVLCLNTGLRLGETYALQWSKTNLSEGWALIDATYDAKKKTFVQRTKGKKFRKVPLNDDATSVLRELILAGRKMESERCFARVNYDYMTHEQFRRFMSASGNSAALARRCTFHSLRHTFATKFMREDGNLYDLQHVLGHSSITQTEKYAHFAPNYLSNVTKRVSFSAPKGTVLQLAGSQ